MATQSYPWLKPASWGALAGVVGITVLGFWQFGWAAAAGSVAPTYQLVSECTKKILAGNPV